MSKPAPPAGKPNFMTTAIMMIAVFFLFQTLMNPQRDAQVSVGGKPVKNSAEILAGLKFVDDHEAKDSAQAKANSALATKLLGTLTGRLSEDVDKKVLTQAQADELKTEATIVAAHVQFKSGVKADDSNSIRMAYTTLEHDERTLAGKPVWDKPITLVEKEKGVFTASGHELYTRLVATISERNQRDLIWGAIPGGYQAIDFLVGLTGHNPNWSYAIATLLLALIVRSVVFPLSQKQLMMSRQMSQLTPRLSEIKEKFKDDPQEMNKRSMELYSRYGINPFSGCLPALVQMPLFLTVYQCILHYQFEFTKGYFLWIAPGPSKATNGFFAPNLGQQDYLLIVIYGITMVVSTLLTPVTDPTQAKQQRMIGLAAAVIFPVMMLLHLFPVVSGFVLYWTFTNLFSTAQSLRAYRLPMPPLVEVNAPGGGVFPGKPKGRWAQMMEEMQRAATEQQSGQKGPSTEPKTGNGKISPSRPVGEEKKDGGSGGTGVPAKHKPKKRK